VTVIGNKAKPVWSQTAVRRILLNKAAIGFYTVLDPPVPGYWPPVVSDEIFYAAQAKLNVAKKVKSHTGSDTNLFTSLAVCGRCGLNLIGHTSDRGAHPRLVCSGAANGRSDCKHTGVPMRLLERAVLDFLGEGDLIREKLSGQAPVTSRVDQLAGELADAEKQAAKLAKLILGDDDPPRMLYDRLKLEERRAKRLQAELDEEKARAASQRPALSGYLEFAATLPALAADKSRRAELRRAIQGVIEKITINPHGEPIAAPAPARKNRGHFAPKARLWQVEIRLRGASEAIGLAMSTCPESWAFRSLKPVEYCQPGANRMTA